MAEGRIPIPLGGDAFERAVYNFLSRGHDTDGEPHLGDDRYLRTDKTLYAGRSLVVAAPFTIVDDAILTIEDDAVLVII